MYDQLIYETRWVVDWIGRMTQKYGATVYEKNGKWWDWGQALCRECYGEEWNKLNLIDPTMEDVRRAKAWEDGDIPEWVDTSKQSKIYKGEKNEFNLE